MEESLLIERLNDFTTLDKEFPFELSKTINVVNYKGDEVALSSLFEQNDTSDTRSTMLMFGRNLL
jgi:hypothetical protein